MMREVSKSKSLPLFILFLVSMFLLSQWLKIIKKVSSVSVITTFYLCHLNANAPKSLIVSSILNVENETLSEIFHHCENGQFAESLKTESLQSSSVSR